MAPNPVYKKNGKWYHTLVPEYSYNDEFGPFESAKEAWNSLQEYLERKKKKMKVTGYQIREALKEWRLKKDLAAESFRDSLFAFSGETCSVTPSEYMQIYEKAESAIVALQEAQISYNMAVTVKLGDSTITLANAIKRIGGIGRAAKMWRDARNQKVSKDYLGGRTLVRDKDEEFASKVISDDEITKKLTKKVREENQLRAAIAAANAREIDLDLDASLLSRD